MTVYRSTSCESTFPCRQVPEDYQLTGRGSCQWLNHYALFSGGYREDALDCMEKLVEKYGQVVEEEDDPSDLS